MSSPRPPVAPTSRVSRRYGASSRLTLFASLALLLSLTPKAALAQVNLVPNPSMETPAPDDPSRPQGWRSNTWGGVQATFSYLSEGHDGGRSVQATITQSGSGDAKWWTDPFAVPGGGWYRLEDAFRADVASELLVQALGPGGQSQWIPVQTLAPSAAWAVASSAVSLPDWTTEVQVAHLIRAMGSLQIDSVSLVQTEDPYAGQDGGAPPDGGPPSDSSAPAESGPAHAPALVSVTFDDGWLSSYVHAVPVMQELGIRASHYIVAGWVDKPGYQSDYMTSEQLLELSYAGHELGSHSLYHDNLTQLSADDLSANITESKAILEGLDLSIAGFVPPGGAIDEGGTALVKEHYSYLRTVEGGLNHRPFDRYWLKCLVVINTTPLSEIAAAVQEAAAQDAWLILLYHRFSPTAPADTYVTPDQFRAHMEHLINVGARILPVGEVLQVWTPAEPPPPVQTGKVLPPPDLSQKEEGCAAAGRPGSGGAAVVVGLVVVLVGGAWGRRRHARR